MVKTQNAFIRYLQIVLSENSPNSVWAINNLVYVRQAAGIQSHESLNISQLINRLNHITNEQAFIESLLLQTPAENLMAYTADIWAKLFESNNFKVNDLSVSAKRRFRNYVSLRLGDLKNDLGLSDYWAITANAGNYQSMIDALPKKSRYKYQQALDNCIHEVEEQINFDRYGGSIKNLQTVLTGDSEAYEIFKAQMAREGYTTFLTQKAQQNIAAENQFLRENLLANGVDKKSVEAYIQIQKEQRNEVLLKLTTGRVKEKEPLDRISNPLQRLTTMIKNTASSIKADPIKFAKTFAHGAVKSAIINAAVSLGSLPLTALAVTGVTGVWAVNQYRTMQQEYYKTELAKSKYHVNAMTELTVNQYQEFDQMCAEPEIQKQIRSFSKNMSLSPELKKQLVVKTAMELGSNVLMAIPGGKLIFDNVVGGSKIAAQFLADTTKNLTSSFLQGVKYYQNLIFKARNRGATEDEIKNMRKSYLRSALDSASISFLSRATTTSLGIVANDIEFGNTTLMEKLTDFHRTQILDKIPLIDKMPFLNNLKSNQATLAEIQTQEIGKAAMPEPEAIDFADETMTVNHENELLRHAYEKINELNVKEALWSHLKSPNRQGTILKNTEHEMTR